MTTWRQRSAGLEQPEDGRRARAERGRARRDRLNGSPAFLAEVGGQVEAYLRRADDPRLATP